MGKIVWFLVIMAVFGFCKGSIYKVGDSAGWNIVDNVDYKSWASSKTFKVGDTLVFEYDPKYHDVLQVSRSDFHSCAASAPIATYATGNDSVVLRRPGHYYYICSFTGHCQAGQMVDIRVPKNNWPGESPIQAPNGSTVPTASSIGPLMFDNGLLNFCVGLLVFLVFNVIN